MSTPKTIRLLSPSIDLTGFPLHTPELIYDAALAIRDHFRSLPDTPILSDLAALSVTQLVEMPSHQWRTAPRRLLLQILYMGHTVTWTWTDFDHFVSGDALTPRVTRILTCAILAGTIKEQKQDVGRLGVMLSRSHQRYRSLGPKPLSFEWHLTHNEFPRALQPIARHSGIPTSIVQFTTELGKMLERRRDLTSREREILQTALDDLSGDRNDPLHRRVFDQAQYDFLNQDGILQEIIAAYAGPGHVHGLSHIAYLTTLNR